MAGKDDDEDSGAGDAGGVLRASGADADGLENKDIQDDGVDRRRDGDDSERRCNKCGWERGKTGCSHVGLDR
jgi:hypothetical protein